MLERRRRLPTAFCGSVPAVKIAWHGSAVGSYTENQGQDHVRAVDSLVVRSSPGAASPHTREDTRYKGGAESARTPTAKRPA